jgi:CheY-like chemotaxis protein
MSGHAADKNISLTVRMDDDIPRFVKGDPTRLRQVLLNLMGNAIKFTEKGGVVLYVKNMNAQKSDNKGKYSIYFGVQDSGIGISPEAQKNLFNPFSQANSSIARKFGGSGLGLAISKGLVEKMGSTVNISSNEGEGTTFFFTLQMERGIAVGSGSSSGDTPAQKPHHLPEKTETKAPLANSLKILLVDDNDITRKVVCSFLKEDNHIISQTTTAEEALDKIEKDSFDLVFMDIELPGMAGNEAVKILRLHNNPEKARLPVVALTGNVGKEYLDQYIADGMTGFVAKPIDPDKLKEIVNYISKQKTATPQAPQTPQAGAPQVDTQKSDGFVDAADPFVEGEASQEPAAATTVFNPDLLQSLKDTIGIESLNSLLDDLIIKTDEILSDMQKAIAENDVPSLAARAHELKGMAGNFGLVEISSIAEKAEKKAKQNDSDGLSDLIFSLPDASTRAKGILKEWVAR